LALEKEWHFPAASLLPYKRTATLTTEPMAPYLPQIFFSIHLNRIIYLFDPTSISIVLV
jgi:hypothetical protein